MSPRFFISLRRTKTIVLRGRLRLVWGLIFLMLTAPVLVPAASYPMPGAEFPDRARRAETPGPSNRSSLSDRHVGAQTPPKKSPWRVKNWATGTKAAVFALVFAASIALWWGFLGLALVLGLSGYIMGRGGASTSRNGRCPLYLAGQRCVPSPVGSKRSPKKVALAGAASAPARVFGPAGWLHLGRAHVLLWPPTHPGAALGLLGSELQSHGIPGEEIDLMAGGRSA
jgi:hypothetical protein